MAGSPYVVSPVLIVLTRKLVLIYFTHRFLSNNFWPCCILTQCHTPTSFLLADSILLIFIAIIWIITCLPHGVHWTLIQIFFQFFAMKQYNDILSTNITSELTNFTPY